MPNLPKLEMEKDWPKLWMIIEHWLTKPKYSAGKSDRLTHIDSEDEFNNVTASMGVDDALVSVLAGDALKKFLHRKDLFQGKDDYTFGHGDLDEYAALDATLVPSATVKLNTSVSSYAYPCPSIDRSPPPSHGMKLPKALSFLLTKGVGAYIPALTIHNMVLAMADTGATNHMCPERSAFIPYHSTTNINVFMGNKTLAPVHGKRTAVISLNGKLVLVRNVLHAHTLHTPLYSLHNHLT